MSTQEQKSCSQLLGDETDVDPASILEEKGTTTVREFQSRLEAEYSVEVTDSEWSSEAQEYHIESDADYVLASERISYDQTEREVLRGEVIDGVEAPLRVYRNERAFVVLAQK